MPNPVTLGKLGGRQCGQIQRVWRVSLSDGRAVRGLCFLMYAASTSTSAASGASTGAPLASMLIGGYMVELGKGLLPEGTLFEALVETGKCLPDAVQLLTLCSTGNRRLHIRDLGLYAVSLYNKKDGVGVRISIDPARLYAFPEIRGWFMKEKPKYAQDINELERQIEDAGHSICKVQRVQMDKALLGHVRMRDVFVPVLRGGWLT